MSRQLISKMGKQSILQRQAAAAALQVQRGVRQRPLSCLAMCTSDRQNNVPTGSISAVGPQSFRSVFRQQPSSCLTTTATATTILRDQRVRWFSEGGVDDKKSHKEKKKEMKQKAKEAAAAKAAEAEAKDAPASEDEAAASADKKEEPTKAEESPPQTEEKPKEEDKKEEDEVPSWQNPLHHNNPEMQKMFPEDFGPGEEMPIAEAPPLADPENPEKVLASQELYDLADEIVNLSMLEMTELVNKIGDHFGFEKPPFVGSDGSGGGGGDDADDEDGEGLVAEPAAAKTAFDIKLVSFDDKAKIKVIKEVRALAGLGLKEAKEMVEGAPGIVMKDIGKEQAEELKTKLEAAGATVEIV